MSAVKNIFKAIDFLFDTPQNKRRDIKDPEGTVVIEKDILYDEKYPKDCLMDFYHVPRSNGEKYPVVLYIHGGGWEAGDKKFRSGISKWYALNGWYVVNINYVLCPEYKYPVPVQNVVTAYNWIVDNAERLNLSLDNFIVTGDSAGSYFAAMVGAIDKNPTLQDKLGCATKHPVQALVLNCGVYDLRYAFVSKRLVFNLGELMLKDYVDTGRKSFESNEYADFISPIDYLNENFPPCFITYSKKDLFCGGQGELLEAALTKIGVYYEAYHSKQFKNNHCFSINTRSKEALENDMKTLNFLRRFRNRAELANWKEGDVVDFHKEHKSLHVLEKRAKHRIRHAEHRGRKVERKIEKHNRHNERK